MFLVIFVFCFTSFVAWYQFKYQHRNYLLAKIPTPQSYPLIGNSLELYGKVPKDFFKLLETYSLALGPIYVLSTHLFDKGTLVIRDPKMTEAILSSQKSLSKSDDYSFMKGWLGTGLLITTGKKWFQRRKILTPSFHFQILGKFVEIMDEQGDILVTKLEQFVGQEVDIIPLINHYALDVICSLLAKVYASGPVD